MLDYGKSMQQSGHLTTQMHAKVKVCRCKDVKKIMLQLLVKNSHNMNGTLDN